MISHWKELQIIIINHTDFDSERAGFSAVKIGLKYV